MADNKSDGLLGGVLIGAAIGAIAGILAAPRTGKETRRILKKSADALPELAEDLATSIQFQADRLSNTGLQNWEGTLSRLREAVVAGRSASRGEWQKHASVATATGPNADDLAVNEDLANDPACESAYDAAPPTSQTTASNPFAPNTEPFLE